MTGIDIMIKYWWNGEAVTSKDYTEYEIDVFGYLIRLYDSPRECIKAELEKLYISKEEIQDKICKLHDLYNILPKN